MTTEEDVLEQTERLAHAATQLMERYRRHGDGERERRAEMLLILARQCRVHARALNTGPGISRY